MTDTPHGGGDEDRRGWVILVNWVLVGLGVACVAGHAGMVAWVSDSGAASEGWPRIGVALIAVPSVLIGVPLGIASAARRSVPRLIRRVELLLLLMIVAAMSFELVTAFV